MRAASEAALSAHDDAADAHTSEVQRLACEVDSLKAQLSKQASELEQVRPTSDIVYVTCTVEQAASIFIIIIIIFTLPAHEAFQHVIVHASHSARR